MNTELINQVAAKARELLALAPQLKGRWESDNDVCNAVYDSFDAAIGVLLDAAHEELTTLLSVAQDEMMEELDPPVTTPLDEGLTSFLTSQAEQLTALTEQAEAGDEDDDGDEGDEDDEDKDDQDGSEEPVAAKPRVPVADSVPGKFQTYRGDIRAAVGVGGSVAFVTVHPD